jgi:hypothetical protein
MDFVLGFVATDVSRLCSLCAGIGFGVLMFEPPYVGFYE